MPFGFRLSQFHYSQTELTKEEGEARWCIDLASSHLGQIVTVRRKAEEGRWSCYSIGVYDISKWSLVFSIDTGDVLMGGDQLTMNYFDNFDNKHLNK
jgi:hypothetical protein